ncbi:ATP-binding cassette domain-containing protein [Paenibacillus sp. OV219]|uniref:ATP-binding cassette domain-containing protein n=1 Tax=Paenibacillus sp. OV219 TaxID=1884377 RepID=UPI0008B4203F|nr:ATP-binding cassette domain-containing protein [Paenibacillus sp. OV219]SEO52506.1 ABC-2 type transport system ATP-binding protein [Paenibacillus sp. OV219]
MNLNAIEIHGLRKSYGQQTVLNGIDLIVPTGTIYALLGPNGAGKTTLIHILTTLTNADAGTAKVAGHDVATDQSGVKRSISLTGQFAAVDEMLTSRENLNMIGRLSGLTSANTKVRTAELLELFDLTAAADKRVKTYSGGMRRKLDLAISLVVERPVLFLDEPTTGLDTTSRRSLWDIIVKLKSRGITVFLTTQYLEEADQLADKISVISGGNVVATGTSEQLKSRIGGEVIELIGEDEQVVMSIPTSGSLHDVRQTLNGLGDRIAPGTRVTIRKPSMDDVFVALTTQLKEEASV